LEKPANIRTYRSLAKPPPNNMMAGEMAGPFPPSSTSQRILKRREYRPPSPCHFSFRDEGILQETIHPILVMRHDADLIPWDCKPRSRQCSLRGMILHAGREELPQTSLLIRRRVLDPMSYIVFYLSCGPSKLQPLR
jgi:hypothetical protein